MGEFEMSRGEEGYLVLPWWPKVTEFAEDLLEPWIDLAGDGMESTRHADGRYFSPVQ